jgi:hypothetical protein
MTWLINFTRGSGLRCGSTSGGNHVPSSYHWIHRAVDMYGPPERMMALQKRALNSAPSFREAFYDPAGRYVKNGRVIPGAIGGHRDHVHLAR